MQTVDARTGFSDTAGSSDGDNVVERTWKRSNSKLRSPHVLLADENSRSKYPRLPVSRRTSRDRSIAAFPKPATEETRIARGRDKPPAFTTARSSVTSVTSASGKSYPHRGTRYSQVSRRGLSPTNGNHGAGRYPSNLIAHLRRAHLSHRIAFTVNRDARFNPADYIHFPTD